MQSFALVGLLAALFTSGVTAGPYKRWGIHELKFYIIFRSDASFNLRRLGRTLPRHSHLLLSLYPTPQCLPSPPVQVLHTPSQRVIITMDQGPQSSSAALSTPLCILACRTTRRCQLFLRVQCPSQHLLYPQTVLPHPPTVKDPGAQYISATPPIPLLLQVHPPSLMRHLSVFQLVQVLLSPCPLAFKVPGTQSTSSAALLILLLFHRVLLAPQMMQHQHRFLPARPPPQRPLVAPQMYNVVD